MISKYFKRKISIFLLTALIIGGFLLIPKKKENIQQIKKEEFEVISVPIFLLYKDTLIREDINIKKDDTLNVIKEIINYLTVNSKRKYYLPSDLKAIIPEGTEVLDLNIIDNILLINFSKELLNINSNYEDKLIESLIYSLVDNKEIQGLSIFVEGNYLTKLPNSNTVIPEILTKDYGINKKYAIDNIKNTNMTTIYYLIRVNDELYYTPVSIINNSNKEKIEIIIEELTASNLTMTNLISYLKSSTILNDYTINDTEMNLFFNEYLFTDLNTFNILEEVQYTIYNSITLNYPNIKMVNFYYNDEMIRTLNIT